MMLSRLSSKVSRRDVLMRQLSSVSRLGSGGAPRMSTLGYESFPTTLDPTQSYKTYHRHQHQLAPVNAAAVDDEHREAMRLFMGKLHAASANYLPTKTTSTSTTALENDDRPSDEENLEVQSPPEEIILSPPAEQSSSSEQQQQTIIVSAGTKKTKPALDLLQELKRAIKKQHVSKAVHLFEKAVDEDQMVEKAMVVSLFYLLARTDPFNAYSVLKYYNAHPEAEGVKVDMYRKLCHAVSLLDPKRVRQGEIHEFVKCLLTELEETEMEVKQQLYPRLVASLATQRSVSIGPYAGVLYKYMAEHNFEMTAGWLRKLLSVSKYNRQEDLPFHDILSRLVAMESYPHPFTTLPAIHNMFPYTDPEQMCVALQAVLDLQQQSQEHGKISKALYTEHSIDRATLEIISTGAAHAGSSQLIMLVWDVLEQCQYKPTEAIYENTVVAFAVDGDGLEEAFAAMVCMKEDGFEVSRPLIRSVSRAIRPSPHLIHDSLRLLTLGETSSELVSLESLNTIMSSYAERGDVNDAVAIFDILKERGIKPNEDSYSFAIEALGKDIHRRKKATDRAWVHKNVEIADSILTMMEEDGIAPSSDVVRNYIELLCFAKEIKTATSVVMDCLKGDQRDSISNKTIYRVAMANAEAGDIETAKELAGFTTEIIPVLNRKLRSKEQRYRHLESMKQMREEEAGKTEEVDV